MIRWIFNIGVIVVNVVDCFGGGCGGDVGVVGAGVDVGDVGVASSRGRV